MRPLITIQGSTASGKSDLAYRLSEIFDTEIVSADSRQVYKYLDIGTAKPHKTTLEKIPHHLIDIITPDKRYSVGTFVRDADIAIQKINDKDKVPIVCGGTMLYVQSLLHGLSEIPEIPFEAVVQTEAFLAEHTLQQCYEFVTSFDPQFASQISTTDRQRIGRAISVWFAFQTPLTTYWDRQPSGERYTSLNIYVHKDRKLLYEHINQRMTSMIAGGLLEEIRSILQMGYTLSDPGLNTVGYKEFVPVILSNISQNSIEMGKYVDLASQHTRNYAKRQIIWYRKQDFDCVYTDGDDIGDLKETILRFLDI